MELDFTMCTPRHRKSPILEGRRKWRTRSTITCAPIAKLLHHFRFTLKLVRNHDPRDEVMAFCHHAQHRSLLHVCSLGMCGAGETETKFLHHQYPYECHRSRWQARSEERRVGKEWRCRWW